MSSCGSFDTSFDASEASFDGRVLRVSTGCVERVWQWTGEGFVTVGLANLESGRQWCNRLPEHACDWLVPGQLQTAPGDLLSVQAAVSDDDGFTSRHLDVRATVRFPGPGLEVALHVWAYPQAPGLRSQLQVRACTCDRPQGAMRATRRVDYLPVAFGTCRRRLFGYCNETQRRNDTHLDILREEVVEAPVGAVECCWWNSALCLEQGGEGLALIQESHRCVNQQGHDCGVFRCDPSTGLESDGWGILPQEVRADRWRRAWARWWIVYSGGDLDRQAAIKRFDRLRFPVDPARDIYIQANTWGSTLPGGSAKNAAREENVVREIDSQADLGIDVQQIDDGWQGDGYERFVPDSDRYPVGWKNVVDHARGRGVKLGLWAAGQRISLAELKQAWDAGGFVQYKLDFVHLRNHDQIEELFTKVREFVLYTGHRVRVNWDVTENPARFGYFFAREYGSIYLENRKDRFPEWVVYRPHTVLRDLWQVARYLNLNRFQGSVQNVSRVDPRFSDACLHSHAYSVAITLMSTPLFFQETQHYDDAARAEIRALLSVYRAHREAIYRGMVFPIGAKPDNRSWTGFQSHDGDTGSGYLLVLRERLCPVDEAVLAIPWVGGRRLRIHDLCGDERFEVHAGACGEVTFRLQAPGSFLLCRYEFERAEEDRSAGA